MITATLLSLLFVQQGSAFDGGKTSTTVQAEMVSRYFQLDALVNGKPAKLLLDTGAGLNVLTPEAAERLGIKGGIAIQAQGAGNKSTPARLVKLDTFKVGEATVSGEQAVIIPLPEALQCDGLVGYSFLKYFATTFDYANAKLTFADPKAFQVPPQATATELKIAGNHPKVMGSIDGIEGWMTLDTGANGTLTVMSPAVEANKLRERYKVGKPRIAGKGVGGFTMGYFATLQEFKLAGVALPSAPSILSSQTSGALASTDTIANVGAEILNRFVFTLDYAAKKAYFTKTATFDRPYRVDRSGAWIDFSEGSFKLAGVAPDSPAEEAGLKEGDAIVAINGVAVTTIKPLMVSAPLQSPAGTKVKITYKRAGQEETVELTLRDLK